MRINWKVRFKNKAWVLTFLLGLIAMFYQTVKVYEAAKQGLPPQELMIETAKMLVTWLVQIGVIVDPTTKGTSDSKMAMTYIKPRDEIGGEHTPGFTAISQEEHDPSDAPTNKEV